MIQNEDYNDISKKNEEIGLLKMQLSSIKNENLKRQLEEQKNLYEKIIKDLKDNYEKQIEYLKDLLNKKLDKTKNINISNNNTLNIAKYIEKNHNDTPPIDSNNDYLQVLGMSSFDNMKQNIIIYNDQGRLPDFFCNYITKKYI